MRSVRRNVLPFLVLALAAAAGGRGALKARASIQSGIGHVTGTVTDSNGVPLEHIHVKAFYPGEGGPVADVQTDAAGHYTLDLQGTTDYRIFTSNNLGYADELYDDKPCPLLFLPCFVGTPVSVTAFQTKPNIDFSLKAGGQIAGHVYNAKTDAPIQVNGAGSIGFYTLAGQLILTMQSDGTGLFTTPALAPGTYFARITNASGFRDQLFGNPSCSTCEVDTGTPITVTAGTTAGSVDFPLWPGGSGGSISGTVTSTAGTPINIGLVQVLSMAGTVVGSGFTSASGVYTISGLVPGSYYVRTNGDGVFLNELHNNVPCQNCDVTSSGGTLVSVADLTTTTVDFSLANGPGAGSIMGVMTRASDGVPIQQMPVQVFDSSNHLVAEVLTQGAGINPGQYQVALPAGTYYVRTNIPSYSSYINQLYASLACPGSSCLPISGTPVTVTPGGNITDNINFSLTQGTFIGGSVTSATGLPLFNVVVQLFSSTGRLISATPFWGGEAGHYSFQGLPDGTYYLRVLGSNSGFGDALYGTGPCLNTCDDVTKGVPVTITGGVSQPGKDFVLDAGGAITGYVRNTSHAPLASGVGIYSASGVLVKTDASNANGLYSVFGLPAGTYYARTINTLGYRDAVYAGSQFCQPSCQVTDGTPITVTVNNVTSGVDFELAAGVELVQNPRFSGGLTNWSLFATPDNSYLVSQLLEGAFHYYRANPPPGTSNSAVILQNTGAAADVGDPVLVQFDLANTSDVRKRIAVLVHDADFSDLSVCTFWLRPNAPSGRYGILTHPAKSWTNASVSFYAASADFDGGYYRLDNVTMQTIGNTDIAETECIDPLLPVSTPGPAGPELLVNGNFSTGNTNGWTLFGQISSQVTAGVFEFIRPSPNSDPAGAILQPTGAAAAAGDRFTAHFDLGNSSSARKRVTVLLHDLDFSDLTACTFWLEPGQPLSTYAMQGYATQAWSNATISIYAAMPGNEQWIRLDNVSLKKTPSANSAGTECFEPGSTQPAPPAPIGAAASPVFSQIESSSAGSAAQRIDPSQQTGISIDLMQSSGGVLAFESRADESEPPVHVEISIDDGPWQDLLTLPASDDWITTTIDLSPYTGHRVRVRFVSTSAS